MNNPIDIFPSHILAAQPAIGQSQSAAQYLNYLLEERPDLHSAALPWVGHDDLAELMLERHWSRIKATDLQALVDISEHSECDFWISLAILLRLFPDAHAEPPVMSLAHRLIDRINSHSYVMRHSHTPIISLQGLGLYAKIVENQPSLRLSDEIDSKARAHVKWLARTRTSAPRYAMFNGSPIWAANKADPD